MLDKHLPRRPPLDALTGLRFFAAMQIVAFHTGAGLLSRAHAPSALLLVANRGYVAVLFFYILSGFILSYNYLDSDFSRASSRWKFWVARFARIYPAYLLAFVISVPFAPATSLPVTIRNVGLMLTMTQAWSPYTAQIFNFTAWSISVEVFFYFAFPWLLVRLRKFTSHVLWNVMLAAFAVSIALPLFLGPLNFPLTADEKWMFITCTPLFRLPEFVIGVALGLVFVRQKSGLSARQSSLLTVSALLVSVLILATAWPSSGLHYSMNSTLIVPAAALVFGLAQGRGGVARFMAWRPVVILGEASYGIYILQFPVRAWTRMLVPRFDAVLSPLLLIAFAVASFFWYEEPARRAIRRVLSGRAESLPHEMATVAEP